MTRAALSVLDPLNQKPYSIIRSAIACARPAYPEDVSREVKCRIARKIWKESSPVAGTPIELYLATLGVKPSDDLNNVVRAHQAVLHEPTGVYYPTLVAAVRDINGKFMGILRTYLRPEGGYWVHAQKPRMLGDCFGSFVQLDKPFGYRMALASTLETALIVHQACPELAVWSSMSRGNMKAHIPQTVKEIIFCIDDDECDPNNARRIVNDAIRAHEGRGQHIKIAHPPIGWRCQDMQPAE
ncbi:MAG: hypothetical protein PHY92_03470 [Alphaproteobacteria bacterium]|nr:hypothetical protein [Alphaproteobacteria bacterium]